MRRHAPTPYASSFSFGPGPISTTLKALIGANVVMFLVQELVPAVQVGLWLVPSDVIAHLQIWRLATYMFLHGGLFHLLFNMLALWLIGAELERIWRTRYFLKFYFVTGIGAAALTALFSLLPFGFAAQLYDSRIIGASGAIYGLLLGYALYFPDRPIYMYFLFPIPAKYFVMILGAIQLYASMAIMSGVASATHLFGLLVGYLMLKGVRVDPLAEIKYRFLKWKINRARKKFDVYSGGRANNWDRRVH
jgi:membrane associated rhomboid family serine protease